MQNIFFFLLLRSRPKNNVTEILSGNLFSSFGVGTKSAHFMISCFLLNFFFFYISLSLLLLFFLRTDQQGENYLSFIFFVKNSTSFFSYDNFFFSFGILLGQLWLGYTTQQYTEYNSQRNLIN